MDSLFFANRIGEPKLRYDAPNENCFHAVGQSSVVYGMTYRYDRCTTVLYRTSTRGTIPLLLYPNRDSSFPSHFFSGHTYHATPYRTVPCLTASNTMSYRTVLLRILYTWHHLSTIYHFTIVPLPYSGTIYQITPW